MQAAGYPITDAALDVAAASTGGYPFLVRLVGYGVWRVASGPEQRIDETAAAAGVQAARRRLGSLVHEPALA